MEPMGLFGSIMIKQTTNLLDRYNFLGVPIWDFGLRSMNREYSWYFLFKIIVKYPLKSLTGFQAYRKFCKSIYQISPQKIYSTISFDKLMNQIQNDRSSLLVAMGYCQRPLKTEEQPFTCPSKRFNHDCYFVEYYHQITQTPPACSICEIKQIAEMTLKTGASFHIMTSAMDIARDFFIPALGKKRFQYAILFICPYSILPITLPLLICGIKFIIIPYTTGACQNYGDFVRADVGIKAKRTFSLKRNHELILDFLTRMVQNKNQVVDKFSILKKRNTYFAKKLR
jgi:hypothetical protein